MASIFFQGRGNVYLQAIAADGSLGVAQKVCTDSLSIAMSNDRWSHTNKCGAVDVEDATGVNSNAASITMAFANMEDKKFALGALGLITAEGSPGTVTDEELPNTINAGDFYFLGGKTRHRNITGLSITGMTADVDYTLDAESGRLDFLTDSAGSPASTADYGYTDPQHVALFNAGSQEYFLSYEFMNRQQANAEGSLELYRVRFDPADNLDFQSDGPQTMSLKGSALADVDRDPDGDLGQFGRRVLVNTVS